MKRTDVLWAGMSVCLVTGIANAEIIGTGGAGVVVPAPVSLLPGSLDSATTIFGINERQNIVLGGDLWVDIRATGVVSAWNELSGGVIPAGTAVSSHLIHMDTDTDEQMLVEAIFTFDAPILGLIVSRKSLLESDPNLGFVSTLYDDGEWRGPELEVVDRVAIGEDGRSVWVMMQQTTELDEIRVVTAAVPAPGALGVLGGAGLFARRRRRN